jgi:hypothetical protein
MVDSATTLHLRTLPELLIVNSDRNISLSLFQTKNLSCFLGLSQVFLLLQFRKITKSLLKENLENVT